MTVGERRVARFEERFALALLLATVVTLSPLLGAAAAYGGTQTGFSGGAFEATVAFGAGGGRTFLGTLTLPSNATVTHASLTASPAGGATFASRTDDSTAGFALGSVAGGMSNTGAGLTLALRSGAQEFEGAALDLGTFDGTARGPAGVALLGPAGSYTSPPIAWDGASYGRLVADLDPGFNAAAVFDVVDATGSALQERVAPGDPITVDGRVVPEIRVRVSMAGASAQDSPVLRRVGAGHVLTAWGGGGADATAYAGTARYGRTVELEESMTSWREAGNNPQVQGVAGTWLEGGPILGNAVAVGREIWLYVDSMDSGGERHIGRLVSADGGLTWAADALPVLNESTSGWDSGFLGGAEVAYEGGVFKMWYFGAAGGDLFSVGYATSVDGVTWTKYASNPVFTNSTGGFDDHNVGWPEVTKVGATYYMFYAGRITSDARKSIGLATSSDGLAWTRYSGTPVIAHGNTTAGGYDIYPSDIVYKDGAFTLFWTCAADAQGSDTCVSVSTDGVAWAHDGANPIITRGDGPWDSFTAELATRAVDPASGHSHLFFSGRPAALVYSMGRADPARAPLGNFEAVWDVTDEAPARLDSVRVVATVPASTTLAAVLASSSGGGPYSTPEAVALADDTIATAPGDSVRLGVAFGTSDAFASASLSSLRVGYSRFAAGGAFTSALWATQSLIASATLTATASVPVGTAIVLWVSADDGATWQEATSGVPTVFASGGSEFRYRVTLAGSGGGAPTLSRLEVELRLAANPTDVALSTAAGTPLAALVGELAAAEQVLLDPAGLNAALAPFADADPPQTVDVDLYAASSSAGAFRASDVRLNLSFPDTLRVSYAPAFASVELEAGANLTFSARATTTGGVPINYSWGLDGAAAVRSGAEFPFAPTEAAVGLHVLEVTVSNGQFTERHAWAVHVVAALSNPTLPTRPLIVHFAPLDDVVIRLNEKAAFRASFAEPTGRPVTVEWQVYGGLVGVADGENFTVAGTQVGVFAVGVTVRNATGIATHLWNLTVLPTGAPTQNPGGALPGGTSADAGSWLGAAAVAALLGGAVGLVVGYLVGKRARRQGGSP